MKFLPIALVLALIYTSVDVRAGIGEDFDELIRRNKIEQGRLLLESAYKNDPSNYELTFRMSRLTILIGDQEKDEDKQLALYEKALEYANKAIKMDGKKVPGYLYRAASTGKVALFKGIFSVADEVEKVRDDCWYALKLNNGTPGQMGGIHYILGRTHLELSYKAGWLRAPLGLGWGNIEEAYAHLSKARKLKKGYIMYELDYAKCLAEMDREDEALVIARSIAKLKWQEPGDTERKKEAAELVDDLE